MVAEKDLSVILCRLETAILRGTGAPGSGVRARIACGPARGSLSF